MTTLDRVQIRGYKSIDRVDINLGRINVLIGGNGSGKSNFISLFSLMQEIAKGQFQRAVLKKGAGQPPCSITAQKPQDSQEPG